jgi:tricorn protease
MLMNGYSSSGGDALPYFFRQQGLGKLIGTRTWGGLIGLSGTAPFVDGGSVGIPTFRIYNAEGEWIVENKGISPDIEVLDLPELLAAGHDPSIEKAVEVLLKEIEESGFKAPKTPTPPDMTR